ncbi:MAG: hypothetical protein KatS3mg102_1290 [Planctomycetota bacterium]|nr:MAG: hypothetical protein KatS3mg102_1290 [Planctomycetota bacterium]
MRRAAVLRRCAAGAALFAGMLLSALAGLPAAARAEQALPPLEQLLPQDALMLLRVDRSAELEQAWQQSHAAAVCAAFRPVFEELWEGLRGRLPGSQQAGQPGPLETVETVAGLLGGGFELAIAGVDRERGAPRLLARIEVGARERELAQLLGQLARANRHRRGPEPFTHQGIEVRHLVDPPLYHARVGSSWLLALFADDMKQLLDRARAAAGGGSIAAPLAMHDAYVQAKARALGDRPALGWLYLNLQALLRLGEAPPELLQRLGLDSARALGLGMCVDGGRLASSLYLCAPMPKGGRGGIFAVLEQGPVDRSVARLAPASASGLLAVHLDLQRLYRGLMELFAALDPEQAARAEQQLTQAEGELGVAIRQDLLFNLGSDWAWITFPPPAGGLAQTVATVGVRDADRFMNALGKLFAKAGLELRRRTLDGRTYYYALAPLGRLGGDVQRVFERNPGGALFALLGSSLCFTVVGDRLVLGDMPHTLADYFDALTAGGTGPRGAAGASLADVAAFQQAIGGWPEDAMLLSWSEPRASFGGYYNFGLRLAKALEGWARMAGLPLDVNLMPRAEQLLPHLVPGTSSLRWLPDGMLLESRATMGGLDSGAVVLAAVGLGAAIAVPNLLESRKGANEAMAKSTLRALFTFQALFREGDKDGDGRLDYAESLGELFAAGLIDEVLASGRKQGYRFRILSADEDTWSAVAEPLEPGRSGDRWFFIDETGVIRQSEHGPASADSPPVGGR